MQQGGSDGKAMAVSSAGTLDLRAVGNKRQLLIGGLTGNRCTTMWHRAAKAQGCPQELSWEQLRPLMWCGSLAATPAHTS